MRYADSLKIDTDEGRYVLIVDDESKGLITYDIHHIALEFYEEVQRELRPWFLEAEHARQTMPRQITTPVEDVYDHIDAGYALDDPKHPSWHSTHADVWDQREGK